MVNILLGAYGHGKSTEIMNKIKEDFLNKKRAFLIVPEQQGVDAERQISELLPPSSQLFIEATNLTRLSDSVFRKTGGLKYNYVTKGGKNLLMYRAICEVRDFIQGNKIPKGKEKSCIKLYLQAITELKTYGVEPESIKKALSELEKDENEFKSLKNKLNNLLLVWITYEKLLKEMYDDPLENLLMLNKKLQEYNYFAGANVYIDSFYGFTKSQLDIVEKIIEQADNVTIALDCPVSATEHTMQYRKITSTKKRLLSLCQKVGKEFKIHSFDEDYKHKSPDLMHVANNLWNFASEPYPYLGNVNLALANNEFEECEYVCSKIKELISKGEKYGSIAIISRNTSTYQGIIDYCLDKYRIPYYISSPSKIMARPLIKMVFSALNAINGMRGEDIINYVKCGYTDISHNDLCLLESYIYKWSLNGKKFTNDDFWNANPDGFVKKPTNTQISNLTRIQETRNAVLKKLQILEKPFISGLSVKECAAGVYEFLNSHNVIEKINKEIKEETPEGAQELSQIWGAFISSLDTIVEICGNTKCNIETFITLLTYVLMDKKIGTIPTGEDNVTVADASLVRAKNVQHVFVLGANEGSFPASVDDSSYFTDSDKITLETCSINLSNAAHIELSAKTDEQSDDELLFFKNSIACASVSATITAISNGKSAPSMGFERINSLLDGCKPIKISSLPIIDKIYTEEIARDIYGSTDNELKKAIENATDIKALSKRFSSETENVSPDVASKIFGNQLSLSKSQIETFSNCHFAYYCDYVLNLRDNDRARFSSNDIGTLIHSIFEHFLKLAKENDKEYTDEEILKIVTELTDKHTSMICGVHALSNKMRHFFNRIKGTVCVFVRKLLDERRHSKFEPEFFEISINGDGVSSPNPLQIPINENNCIVMNGIADRVDVYRHEDTAYIKIFDYKTGNYEFSTKKIDQGLDIQMIIYLLALSSMEEGKFLEEVKKQCEKIEPAGFVYLSYNINKSDSNEEVDLDSNEAIQKESFVLESKITRSGLELNDPLLLASKSEYNLKESSLVDDFEEIFNQVKNAIAKIGADMLQGNAQAEPSKAEDPCRYCKSKFICRRRKSDE